MQVSPSIGPNQSQHAADKGHDVLEMFLAVDDVVGRDRGYKALYARHEAFDASGVEVALNAIVWKREQRRAEAHPCLVETGQGYRASRLSLPERSEAFH